ncbi:metallophosphoesterase family protein [Cyclobacterium marinum]|mgnify:FL=1|uniref:Phosphoesterase n=1 Tax=Cyclobacterium marinum (strain ATCC 25205 / DSM 745 / LMG 13164 / NCIMB 1802) TaxID=880070 RepID=G0IVL1_CYCMS|nr:metallophosphoesterase family protein [Cyclobacterium marinum]AEL24207.1 phosphodiesterase, MJ0936 family [Cyclobacterium marinum DSM 745]MBI0398910.1 metallophosphoesterase family protein [Cyclobacterium marinum]|tara:strand:- start:27656 stop:28156 length:501 start_codon:yes stop_codon:yes gene_type:complete
MVKIALISDTHSSLPENAIQSLEEVDEIWHAGDVGDPMILEKLPKKPLLRAVFGNIDDQHLKRELPEEVLFESGGVKVFMIHIGGTPPRYAKGVKAKIKNHQPNLFVCGHSHICKVVQDKELGVLYMNPGAIGNHGFHQIKTMLTFELDQTVKNLKVIELGKRGRI